jgi:tetratricopeptide (TPR) repeat protein
MITFGSPQRLALSALTLLSVSALELSAAAQPNAPEPSARELVNLFKPEDKHSVFNLDQANPEARPPTPQERDASPVAFSQYLLDLLDKADTAEQALDYRKAISLYRALSKSVPENSVTFRKLCSLYEKLGEQDKAETACAQALTLEGGVIDDYKRYIGLLLKRPGALDPTRVHNADAAFAHLRKSRVDEHSVLQLECLMSLKLQDAKRLRKCVQSLQERSAASAETIGYEWRLGILELDREAASAAIARGRAAGMKAAELDEMERASQRLMRPWQKYLRDFLQQRWSLLIALLGVVVLGWLVARKWNGVMAIRDSKANLR